MAGGAPATLHVAGPAQAADRAEQLEEENTIQDNVDGMALSGSWPGSYEAGYRTAMSYKSLMQVAGHKEDNVKACPPPARSLCVIIRYYDHMWGMSRAQSGVCTSHARTGCCP